MLQASYQRILVAWTKFCCLQLIEHGASELRSKLWNAYMSFVMFVLQIWLLISCHSNHSWNCQIQLINHNVGLGVKTLNCWLPLTSCVNSWHGILASTHGCQIQLYRYRWCLITACSSSMLWFGRLFCISVSCLLVWCLSIVSRLHPLFVLLTLLKIPYYWWPPV